MLRPRRPGCVVWRPALRLFCGGGAWLLCHFRGRVAQFGLHHVAQAVVPTFDERRLNCRAGRFVRMLLAAFSDSRGGFL